VSEGITLMPRLKPYEFSHSPKSIKEKEFGFLVFGAVARVLLRYKLDESQLMVDTLFVSLLAANIIGSFILEIIFVLFVAWNLGSLYRFWQVWGFVALLPLLIVCARNY
jgi:hypothetical protein